MPTAPKNGLVVAPWTLIFTATSVPALGFARFIVKVTASATQPSKHSVTEREDTKVRASSGLVVAKSNKVAVTFDAATGLMSQVERLDTGVTAAVSSDLLYYVAYGSTGIKGFKHQDKDLRDPHKQNLVPLESSVGSTSSQASGAYIFRPADGDYADTTPIRSTGGGAVALSIVEGELVTEVRQTFSSWASQVVRLRKDSEIVELEWTVGPIPIDDGLGKEVISRFSSDIDRSPLLFIKHFCPFM